VIKLVLHVEFKDEVMLFQMDAPSLPPGLTWHEGLTFMPDKYAHGYVVESVYLYGDGTTEVWFFEQNTCAFSEDIIAEYMVDGWMKREG